MTVALRCASALLVVLLASSMALATKEKPKREKFAISVEQHPHIQIVTAETFRDSIMTKSAPIVVFWYTSWCKECAAMAGMLESVAASLDGYLPFASFDATTGQNKQIAEGFSITTFPLLMIFDSEMKEAGQPGSGQWMKVPVVYSGPALAESIAKWALRTMRGDHIRRVEDGTDLKIFLNTASQFEVAKILLVTNSFNLTSPMYKATSLEFMYEAVFGIADASVDDVVERFGITTFPTVVRVQGKEHDVIAKLEGNDVTLAQLKSFVDEVALTKDKRDNFVTFVLQDATQRRIKAEQEAKANKAMPPLVIRTSKQWSDECLRRKKGVCMAVFVDSIEEEALKDTTAMLFETAKKIAAKSQIRMQMVLVEGGANYAVADHFSAATGWPSVVFLNAPKQLYTNLVGSFTEKSIVNFFFERFALTKGRSYDATKVPKFTPVDPAADELADEDKPKKEEPKKRRTREEKPKREEPKPKPKPASSFEDLDDAIEG